MLLNKPWTCIIIKALRLIKRLSWFSRRHLIESTVIFLVTAPRMIRRPHNSFISELILGIVSARFHFIFECLLIVNRMYIIIPIAYSKPQIDCTPLLFLPFVLNFVDTLDHFIQKCLAVRLLSISCLLLIVFYVYQCLVSLLEYLELSHGVL